MNCKQGDLAVFVRSHCGNEGRIVRVFSLLSSGELSHFGFAPGELVWHTDTPLPDTWGGRIPTAPDSLLRPIRDPGEDAQDETLTWLPVPTKEHA